MKSFEHNGDEYEIITESETDPRTFQTNRHYSVKKNGLPYRHRVATVDAETINDAITSKTMNDLEDEIYRAIENGITKP
jgi:hypothetical protein